MLKRLHGLLFGKGRRAAAATPDLSFFPMVGSSTAEAPVDATVYWSGDVGSAAGLDRTVLAATPDPYPATTWSDAPEEGPAERQRLAWPARDASRSQFPEPPVRAAEPAADRRPAPPTRPADDMTVLVARRPRPRQSAG